MPKIYTAFCVVLIILLAAANLEGVVYSTYLFGADSRAAKSANNYHK